MALIVETGGGVPNADSYISRANANTYVKNQMTQARRDAWTNLTATSKDLALRMGTQFLDFQFNQRWLGVRANESQALAWPRQNIEDYDGYILSSLTVPTVVANATVEMAVRSSEGDIFPDFDRTASIKKEEVTVGPLKELIEYVAGDQSKDFRKVQQMLSHVTKSRATIDIERR